MTPNLTTFLSLNFFEALCFTEKGVGYKLSNRAVTLLAKNSEEAEKIRKFMVKAYRVRSKIVHGDKRKPVVINGKTVDLDTFTQRLEKYLRKMVKSFLAFATKYKKQNDIITLLDKSLFGSKTKRLTSFSQKIGKRREVEGQRLP